MENYDFENISQPAKKGFRMKDKLKLAGYILLTILGGIAFWYAIIIFMLIAECEGIKL